ncbi:MAG TPA: lipoprotein-releasing ABC transporter permease subunit [Acetobacteraceae bacterium]|nr:lipoprotein-releasing ABC transporter permease subunit [Acetobacteraceae bacterium]
MFNAFERAVAARYLRARRGERFVSVIAIFSLVGIALGVATLIIVMSVMGGFKIDLLSRILGFNGDLGVYGQGGRLAEYDALAARVAKLPGVVSAVPVLDGQVLITNTQGVASGGYVRGIEPKDLQATRLIATHVIAGSLDEFKGEDVIAVGSGLARQFNVWLNQSVTLVSPQGAATPFGTVPRVKAYRIVAIFNVGEYAYDSNYVFMPMRAAQIYFQKPDAATQIEVTVKDPTNVAPVRQEIERALAGLPVSVVDWQQSNNSFFTAVQVEQNVMFVILTLIILVAAFNVISSLIMMVKDKTRDIAILRTIGAGRGAVMRIFLMCGASVGVAGTVIGAVLGIAFTLNIDRIQDAVQAITGVNVFNAEVYYLTHLPARLDWGEVVKIVVLAFTLSLLATLYPSWRAARTDPVEALRHE